MLSRTGRCNSTMAMLPQFFNCSQLGALVLEDCACYAANHAGLMIHWNVHARS